MAYSEKARDREVLIEAFKQSGDEPVSVRVIASIYFRGELRYRGWPGFAKRIQFGTRRDAHTFRRFWDVLVDAIRRVGLREVSETLAELGRGPAGRAALRAEYDAELGNADENLVETDGDTVTPWL